MRIKVSRVWQARMVQDIEVDEPSIELAKEKALSNQYNGLYADAEMYEEVDDDFEYQIEEIAMKRSRADLPKSVVAFLNDECYMRRVLDFVRGRGWEVTMPFPERVEIYVYLSVLYVTSVPLPSDLCEEFGLTAPATFADAADVVMVAIFQAM